jgi:hypothetical protein
VVGRARALLPLVPALFAIGCGGGGDGGIDEGDLRECLAEGGHGVEAAATASPTLGSASPDLRASIDGLPVDLIVERDDDRARRTAADLRGALSTFGVQNVDQRLLEEGNVIAVFSGDPSAGQREAVASCLE